MFRPLRLTFPLLLAISFQPSLADEAKTESGSTAPDIDTEHIFGFAEGSDIGLKGEREIESVTIGSFGAIGNYNNVDNETSFRYGVTDNLRLSIGTLTDYYNIHGVQGLSDRSSVSFSGLITELRWKIVDRLTQPFGMTLSINPAWRQFDPTSGERSGNYAVPVTLLIDKEVIPNKLFAALNLIYTPSFLRVNGARGHDDSFAVIAAGSYAIAPNIFVGAEIRHENLAENGSLDAHALFVGPSLFYRLSGDFTVKVAWAAQIPDIGATRLDLSIYERHQVELQFAYTF
ncbi:hypothetical protein [Methyloferula stellata]|uniref:hypothetical protein n=1 Tax=Methyloferula stellata TaxID=876270 RepID=UPI00036B692B|nr:hypothetical protein [Methyloferula stellata]